MQVPCLAALSSHSGAVQRWPCCAVLHSYAAMALLCSAGGAMQQWPCCAVLVVLCSNGGATLQQWPCRAVTGYCAMPTHIAPMVRPRGMP
jgi:hypothetical protein